MKEDRIFPVFSFFLRRQVPLLLLYRPVLCSVAPHLRSDGFHIDVMPTLDDEEERNNERKKQQLRGERAIGVVAGVVITKHRLDGEKRPRLTFLHFLSPSLHSKTATTTATRCPRSSPAASWETTETARRLA